LGEIFRELTRPLPAANDSRNGSSFIRRVIKAGTEGLQETLEGQMREGAKRVAWDLLITPVFQRKEEQQEEKQEGSEQKSPSGDLRPGRTRRLLGAAVRFVATKALPSPRGSLSKEESTIDIDDGNRTGEVVIDLEKGPDGVWR